MDYKEKFEDFLDKMQGLFDNAKKQGDIIIRVEDLENTLTELKEGDEDERIREDLIEYFRWNVQQLLNDFSNKEVVAWLEKQGKLVNSLSKGLDNAHERIDELIQKSNVLCIKLEKQGEPNPYSGISLDYNGHTWGMCARDNGVDILLDKQLFKHLEKQDKQKVPVIDFKAKDWYVSKVDGKIHNIYNSVDKVEPKFHEGDWIVDNIGVAHKIERAVLNVTNNTFGYDIVGGGYFNDDSDVHLWTIKDAKDGDVLASNRSIFIFSKEYIAEKPIAYCGLMNGRFLVDGEDACWTNERYYPATKEQRDLLFTKMREADYEWDDEKKELKKISQRMVSAEAKEALYDKPAWSEEDEWKFTDILALLRGGENFHYNTPDLATWLKSLKQRIGWKPSDEQMDALLFVVQHYTPNVTDKLAWDSIKTLELMYHEIKE